MIFMNCCSPHTNLLYGCCSQQHASLLYDIARTLTVLLLQSTYKYNADCHIMLVPQKTADLCYN